MPVGWETITGDAPNGGNSSLPPPPPVYRDLTPDGNPPYLGNSSPAAARAQTTRPNPVPSLALAAAPAPSSSSQETTYRLVPSQYSPPVPAPDPTSPSLTVNIWPDGTQPWLITGAVLPRWCKIAVDPSMTVYDFCSRVNIPVNERSWREGWGVVEVVLVGSDGNGLPRFAKGRVWRFWQDGARRVEEMGRGGDGEVWLALWVG